ncbi:energy transducer TonB [Flavilitoribacter nigricans]|uniref:TonB C-terminal domain-containing protein n=1 Tax=Flavilitoribacter nigricans (strain ATCC 23147 / DSM 23189 / NBRC 102662 / NCIMB 1420 / SS-2) TaxID=1122177 RepID=A0A2D0NGV3_FLAN2|nr:hypothetical protein CRP01_08515 [Flavilitoribacter nigricans DSM 23189 = NBRC 102662]
MKFRVIILILLSIFNFLNLRSQSNTGPGLKSRAVICGPLPKASFPGGTDSLIVFLAENAKWPSPDFYGAGTVLVSFTVERSGKLSDVKLLNRLYESCDKEALRIVNLMPNWVPAKQDARTIRSNIIFPVRFGFE